MNSKPMSQDEFNAAKAEAQKSEPITKRVPMYQIEMDKDSYAGRYVKVSGKVVGVDSNFFKQLGAVLHISDNMRKDLTSDGKGESGLFAKMVDTLKILKAGKNGGGDVTIVGDPTTGHLTGISDKPYNRIPNASLFGIADTLLNKYPSLSATDINVGGGGMKVGISLMSNNQLPFAPKGATEDETFQFGFSLDNDKNTSLGDFAYRLVCSNGVMGMSKVDQFQLKDLSPNNIRKMFEHIAQSEKRQFVPMMFARNMENAINTTASYFEIETLFKAVKDNINCDDDMLKKYFQAEIAKNFFQGYVRTVQRLTTKGVDILEMTDKQKQFISSGQNMWDLINNLTWLGSHDSGYAWKNQALLRKLGGKQMGQEFDLQYANLLNF